LFRLHGNAFHSKFQGFKVSKFQSQPFDGGPDSATLKP
jgi:hypothetical protein